MHLCSQIVRVFFGTALGLLRKFANNLRRICERGTKKGKLSPEEGSKKSDLAALHLINQYHHMKLVMTIMTIILSLMTLFLGYVFVTNLKHPYNSEGRYFDEASATVHHEQAEPVYGLLFTCCTIVTIVTFYKTRKAFYK